MSDHLRCDVTQLEEAAAQLDALGTAFQRAGDVADDARAAVGHPRLAARVGEFADGWEVRREDLLEDMTYLAEMTHEAASTYRQVDDELAAGIEGCGP